MRNRFTGAMVSAAIAAAASVSSLTLIPIAGPARAGRRGGAAAPAPAQPATTAKPAPAQPAATAKPGRLDRIGKAPNINGIYQAINSANWNLEDHPAQGLTQFWQLGAIAAIPAGMSV